MDFNMIVEISSYPKCGNTWMRYIIANCFSIDVHTGIPDIHQQREKTKNLMEQVNIDGQPVGFYKSHVTDSKGMNPDKILCVYRHPLDVFLSCLNYFYLTDRKEMFENGTPVPVETLKEDGRLSEYFRDFSENLGANYYIDLLGKKSNYFEYLDSALDNPKVFPVRYEDVYDAPSDTVRNALNNLFETEVGEIENSVFDKVNKKTKQSRDGFYWKSRKENFRSFLSGDEVYSFHSRHQSKLESLGYYEPKIVK